MIHDCAPVVVQIPRHEIVMLMPQLTLLLAAESNVVHSYAAICIERLLSMKARVLLNLSQPVFMCRLPVLLSSVPSHSRSPPFSRSLSLSLCVCVCIGCVCVCVCVRACCRLSQDSVVSTQAM